MNVLITGGAGFIGQRVVSALLVCASLPDADGNESPITRIRVSDIVRADAMDFRADTDFRDLVKAFIEDDLQ